MPISVNPLHGPVGDQLELEIVERKGIAHPDTICDEIAEEFSLALSRFYLSEFGEILHHNVDKVLLAAGSSRPEFGGGRIVAPVRLFLAGRATEQAGSRTIPVGELGRKAALDWFGKHLPGLNHEHDIEVHSLVHPVSADLGNLFARRSSSQRRLANDTSCCVGYAPFSRLESIAYGVERKLAAMSASGSHPAIGRDIKVMGVREGQRIDLTIACAMVGGALSNAAEYLQTRHEIAQVARRVALAQ